MHWIRTFAALAVLLAACSRQPTTTEDTTTASATCSGPYPSYWQDPAFMNTGMWEGQRISNQPPLGYSGPIYRLSQKFPETLAEDRGDWGWTKFDPFQSGLSQDERRQRSSDYIWAVMRYLQAGNVDHGAGGGNVEDDWNLCENKVRNWYNMPFQTYDPLSGREFMHGLTREAPVKVTLKSGQAVATTIWAVGFYNARGAHQLGKVWRPDGKAQPPAADQSFAEGTVVGKLLFTTGTPEQMPFLKGLPAWRINMSDAAFCACKPSGNQKSCTLQEMSEQCPRSPGEVYLIQFDIAVRDDRAPTGWVFGTFVADGEAKANEANPWNRISALGLMWGNDPPPPGQSALSYPADPRVNGFAQEVVFFDVADRLNQATDAGHLGCNSRLNGPADNIQSSCLSCHMTASVPDKNLTVPPILAQFGGLKAQCANPPNLATDAVYFANTGCSTPFNGGTVVPPPDYASGRKEWISLDYSLQLSISLVQWGQWMEHQDVSQKLTEAPRPARRMTAVLPGR